MLAPTLGASGVTTTSAQTIQSFDKFPRSSGQGQYQEDCICSLATRFDSNTGAAAANLVTAGGRNARSLTRS